MLYASTKMSQIKMKHFVQSKNIHIQFLLNSFKTWWLCSEFKKKKFYYRDKKYVLWPYDCVRKVFVQCLIFTAPLVENHLWLSACGCNYLTNTGICNTQPESFALHPFPINADVQDLLLSNSQHYTTEFSGLDHVSTSLGEMFVPSVRRLELICVNKGAECWPNAVLWGNKSSKNMREQGDFLSPSPLHGSLG